MKKCRICNKEMIEHTETEEWAKGVCVNCFVK